MMKFDDIIRQKLEQLPVEGTPNWSDLENRLEGDAFDALLRDQLSSTSTPQGADKVAPAIAGWEALSSKLDLASEVEGDVFDRILSQKIANIETPLEPQESWKVLSHRMDTLWPLRKVLVRYRVLEMAAAIAFLLTFAPLLRDNPPTFGGSGSITVTTSTALQALPQKSIVLATSSSDQFLRPEEIAEAVYASGSQGTADTRAVQSNSASQVQESSSSIYSPFALLKGMVAWFGASNNSESLGSVADNTSSHQAFLPFADRVATTTQLELDGSANESFVASHFTPISSLALSPLTVSANAVPSLAISPAANLSSKWELGAQAGLQVWNVQTPIDREFEQPSLDRWRGGATTSVTANRAFTKRTALGLGLTLSHLNYDPNLPTVLDAADFNERFSFSRAESFDGISLNIAQVPVDFRVSLTNPGKRLKLVAYAGVAANLTLSSEYDLQQEIGFSIPSSGPSEFEEVLENERTFSDAKDFSSGVLEGGSLAANSFLSGRLGLETSVQINKRLSAFSNLSYSHFLPVTPGIGPNKDELNAVGLTIGARVSL